MSTLSIFYCVSYLVFHVCKDSAVSTKVDYTTCWCSCFPAPLWPCFTISDSFLIIKFSVLFTSLPVDRCLTPTAKSQTRAPANGRRVCRNNPLKLSMCCPYSLLSDDPVNPPPRIKERLCTRTHLNFHSNLRSGTDYCQSN